MALQAGIVGLPNVGKSTLFNAVSNNAKAQASNYRFCTIEPNVGLVDVPDPRLYKLADLVHPHRVVPTQIEIVDIAGLVVAPAKVKVWATNSWQTSARWIRSSRWCVVLKMTIFCEKRDQSIPWLIRVSSTRNFN